MTDRNLRNQAKRVTRRLVNIECSHNDNQSLIDGRMGDVYVLNVDALS